MESDSDKPQMQIRCSWIFQKCSGLHPCWIALVQKELTYHLQYLVVERYWSGERYWRISKTLDETWWKLLSVSGENREPQGHLVDWWRNLNREVTKRPTATLKKLQEFLAGSGHSLHVTISWILSQLRGRMERQSFLTKRTSKIHCHSKPCVVTTSKCFVV